MRASGLHLLLVLGTLHSTPLAAIAQNGLPPGARCRLGSPANPLLSICFSPDSRVIATAGYDNVIQTWDTHGGKMLRQWKTPEGSTACLRFSPNGRLLASGGVQDSVIHLWEATSGRLVRDLEGLPRGVTSLCFSPDNKFLAAGGYRTDAILVWDVGTGRELAQLSGPRVPVKDENFQGADGIQYGYVCFSPDGASLASGHPFGLVRIWDFAKRRQTNYFRGDVNDAFVHLAFSPDGAMLATWSQSIRLWTPLPRTKQDVNSISTWAESLGITTPPGWAQRRVFGSEPDRGNAGLSFSTDNRLVASGSTGDLEADPKVHIWEASTGSERLALPGHEFEVTATAFSPDGRTFASASRDGTALLWDLKALQTSEPDGHGESSEDLEHCWSWLGQPDGKLAGRALRAFLRAPARSVTFLGSRLEALVPVSNEQVKQWVYALDSKSFQQRETAAGNLAAHFEVVEAQLRAHLPLQASVEGRRRLKQILDSCGMGELAVGQLRAIRSIEILEDVGSPEARSILERLARGDARLKSTREALAALERLKKVSVAQRNIGANE